MQSPIAVIGGTGFAGSATVNALVARKHAVRLIARTVPTGARPLVEPFAADASNADSLTVALEGVGTAILCARPDYWKWPTELVPMIQAVVTAARRTGTRLVFCDNLYAYGIPDGPLTETSPLRPHGPKGRARKEAAEVLMRHHEAGHLKVAIGRGADFYGEGADYPNLKMLFGAALEGKPVRLMGKADVLHSVSYLGDVGNGLATLATRDEAFGQVWHLPVAKPETEWQLAEKVVAAAGAGSTISSIPPWAVSAMFRVAGLFSPMMRELPEVQYQHERPFVVDDSRFVAAFGERAVDQHLAITRTLDFWRERLGLSAPGPAVAAAR